MSFQFLFDIRKIGANAISCVRVLKGIF